jgi:hypothetical protein
LKNPFRFLFGVLAAAFAWAGPNLPLDRPYTLRNSGLPILEQERSRQIRSQSELAFILPRACHANDSAWPCRQDAKIRFGDSTQGSLGIQAIVGEEYRHGQAGGWSTEGGMLAAGEKASASFALDARFYTDVGGDLDGISFDREQVDVQDGDVTGSISYKSYVRYRGNFSLDLPVGRFGVARDAAHWGPGIFGNLVFNQDAVPFDQVN